jgi:hypothetical protein
MFPFQKTKIQWCHSLHHITTTMIMTTFQKIPAMMTMTKAVLSILQVIVGRVLQFPYPKGGQGGAV